MIITQLTKEEFTAIINDAVHSAMHSNNSGLILKPLFKGLHELDKFLKISPGRAQNLKKEEVIPCFQDGRLAKFDPDKELKAIESHNESSAKRKGKKK